MAVGGYFCVNRRLVGSSLTCGATRWQVTLFQCFYLKAHRAKYRDRLNIDVNALDRDIEQRLRDLRERGFKIDFYGPGLVSITPPPNLLNASNTESL